MHTKYKSLVAIAFAALAAGTSCTKLSKYNENPNATTKPPAAALLTGVEAGLGGYAYQTTPGYYCQYFSQTQYTSEENYSPQLLGFSGTYSGSLEDLQNLIDNSGVNNMAQIARIIKGYIIWTITDRVGDIPYTGTLKGGNGLIPYDTQETVYKGIIADLTEAVGAFDASSIVSGDIVFGGDVSMWIKTANSIRMLMALRLSNQYPAAGAYAATEFAAAMNATGGAIMTNADNFKLNYPGDNASTKNPIFVSYDGRKDNAESNTMTGLLGSLNDGRQEAYGGITESTTSQTDVSSDIGFPYDATGAQASAFLGANPNWARVLKGKYRLANSPMFIITAGEVNLAIAEAIDRGWVSGTVNTYYQAGITASFDQWALGAPAASYFTQAGVALTAAGTAANIKQIATQRYIATYPDGLQGWSEWRRTGYPVLVPSVNATNESKQIPRRYAYGTGEYSSNEINTKAAAAAMGGDTQDTHVWWDK